MQRSKKDLDELHLKLFQETDLSREQLRVWRQVEDALRGEVPSASVPSASVPSASVPSACISKTTDWKTIEAVLSGCNEIVTDPNVMKSISTVQAIVNYPDLVKSVTTAPDLGSLISLAVKVLDDLTLGTCKEKTKTPEASQK